MPSSSIDKEIHILLNRMGSPSLVAGELITRWRSNLFSPSQQRAVAQFFLDAGLEKKLLGELSRIVLDRRPMPWAQFALALLRSRIVLSEEDIKALIDGLENQTEQSGFDDILDCPGVDAWSPGVFNEKRVQRNARRALDIAKRKSELRERLLFFRNNRMYDEESATLEQLQAMFPEDAEFREQGEEFAERWAREVLANRATVATDLTSELRQRASALSPEQQSIKDRLTRHTLNLAAHEPSAAYDLALLLVFMEFYSEAIEILELAPDTPAKDWLRLELLLKARQYVSVLEEVNRLEVAYAGNPESTFSVIYARARALWGLGQAAMAIDLMRNIVNVRPHYKSASSLLAAWGGGET